MDFSVLDLHSCPRSGAYLAGPDDRPELVYVIGIKPSDIRRLMSEVIERRDELE